MRCTPWLWSKVCRGKHRHKSRGAAEAHIRALNKESEHPNLVAYLCRFCKCWHVGHSN